MPRPEAQGASRARCRSPAGQLAVGRVLPLELLQDNPEVSAHGLEVSMQRLEVGVRRIGRDLVGRADDQDVRNAGDEWTEPLHTEGFIQPEPR